MYIAWAFHIGTVEVEGPLGEENVEYFALLYGWLISRAVIGQFQVRK